MGSRIAPLGHGYGGPAGRGADEASIGVGGIGGLARAFEPRSSTGAVRGSLSPEGSPVWGPYGGEPLLVGAGASALAPHVGGTGPSLCSFSVAPGCVVHVVFPFLRNRFDYFTPPLLAAVFPPSCSGPSRYCVKRTLRALDGLVEGGGDPEVGACLVELH